MAAVTKKDYYSLQVVFEIWQHYRQIELGLQE